jgi:Regulator of G protein signaling domain
MSRKVTDLSMITPHMSTFDASQKRVYNMLENDAYQRFLQWHIYLQLVQQYEEQENPDHDQDHPVEVEDSGCYNESSL